MSKTTTHALQLRPIISFRVNVMAQYTHRRCGSVHKVVVNAVRLRYGPNMARFVVPYSSLAVLLVCTAISGCAGAGPWGAAREYAPLGAEEEAAVGAKDFDPVMVGRFFQQWVGKSVSVFGVVDDYGVDASGEANLLLSVRVLQDRNLCEDAAEDTCKVTVSENEFATINARVNLLPSELNGPDRLTRGSLVRVIGKVAQATDPKSGNYVINTVYHRHWPLQHFVTTAARSYMLR